MRALKFGAIGLLLLVVAAIGYWIFLLRPATIGSTANQDIVFSAGSSRDAIASQLKNNGLIRSRPAFLLYARFIHLVVLPGTYELSPGLSASQIGEVIGSGRFKTAKVIIIEGWRATDMERYLVDEKPLAQFVGFAAVAEKSEGYLFPDTYEIKVDATTPDLIKLMRDNFDKRTKDLKITPETVILASIVEREAKDDAERGAIAQVYINRLAKGMKLEADPTIQYAKGNWKAVLLSEYRSVISPYNTYLNDGLPPGAICNPGLKSIEAVIDPTPHDYLYFFHAKGETFFSKTYEEHVAKVRKNF
jgi:UPF0755 protein